MKKKLMILMITAILGTVSYGIESTGDPLVDRRAKVLEEFEITWSAQPKLGIIKGEYYKAEERFRQGHLGELEIVKNSGKIVHVEFNEITRANYYNRYYQNAPKRLSDYNFSMGEKAGAAWIEGVIAAEKSIMKNQNLTDKVDIISGASNSIKQSMMVLAEEINKNIDKSSEVKYYGIAEKIDGGLTGRLQVLVKQGKIISVRYDEIFADTPEEIKEKNLKPFYRQSKSSSITYDEPSRIGFNVQMDELNKKVVETQNMLDLTGLPAIADTGNYGKSGFTRRNTAWDNYLNLAEKLLKEMKKDKIVK
ncbi:MAG: FMN-binding protein [Fusobacteriaceae bacterium]